MTSLPKGVYRQTRTLADGSKAVYLRWRATGKRIEGELDTEEFERSLEKAKIPNQSETAGTWSALVKQYKLSPNYAKLDPDTKKYYDRQLERAKKFGPKTVAEIKRADFLTIRDAIAMKHPQSANQFAMVMSVLMDFAVEREQREINPLVRIKRIRGGTHKTWTDEQIRYALTHFAEQYRRAVILALYTGQREGDCCAMKWSQYDGTAIEVVPEKTDSTTGVTLWIPAHRTLKKELDAWKAEAKSETILVNGWGKPWPTHSFASMICKLIGRHDPLKGLVFHGLRKAAAARLAEVGCSVHEIASITGHASLKEIERYTKKASQRRRAERAIAKLELVKD